MAKKDEKVFIQIDNEKIELTGSDLEAFEADRKAVIEAKEQLLKQLEELKQTKISAYKKLGLTDEEIAAII